MKIALLPAEDIARLRDSFLVILPQSDLLGQTLHQHIVSEFPEFRRVYTAEFNQLNNDLLVGLAWMIDHLDDSEYIQDRLTSIVELQPLLHAANELLFIASKAFIKELAHLNNPTLDPKQLNLWALFCNILIDLLQHQEAASRSERFQKTRAW